MSWNIKTVKNFELNKLQKYPRIMRELSETMTEKLIGGRMAKKDFEGNPAPVNSPEYALKKGFNHWNIKTEWTLRMGFIPMSDGRSASVYLSNSGHFSNPEGWTYRQIQLHLQKRCPQFAIYDTMKKHVKRYVLPEIGRTAISRMRRAGVVEYLTEV